MPDSIPATSRPQLDPADDLTTAVSIDLNAALSDLHSQRTTAPIIRPSREADVAALIDQSFPQGGDSLEQLEVVMLRLPLLRWGSRCGFLAGRPLGLKSRSW